MALQGWTWALSWMSELGCGALASNYRSKRATGRWILPPPFRSFTRAAVLRAIAAGLEERGIPTARGGKWSAVQLSRLLEAARSPFGACVAVA